jgi:hypothetical protein
MTPPSASSIAPSVPSLDAPCRLRIDSVRIRATGAESRPIVRHRALLLAIASICPVWIASAPIARADPVRLRYERAAGADSCPDEAAFRELVAARLGHDAFDDQASHEVRVTIVAVGRALRASIEHVEDGTVIAERSLRGSLPDCSELASTLALALAITIDPLAASGPPPAAATVEVAPPTTALPPTVAVPATPPVVDSSRDRSSLDAAIDRAAPHPLPRSERAFLGIAFHLDLTGSFFASPEPSVGGALGAQLFLGELASILAEARAVGMPVPHRGDRGESVVWLTTGALAGCVGIDIFSGCAGIVLGATSARSSTVTEPTVVSTLYSAAEARAGIGVPLGAIAALRAHAALQVPFLVTETWIDDAVEWRSPPVSFSVSAGVSVRVP